MFYPATHIQLLLCNFSEQRKTRQRDKDKSHSTTQGPAAPNKGRPLSLLLNNSCEWCICVLVSSEEWDSLPAATTAEQNEDWGREGDVWQQAMLTEQVNISTVSIFTHMYTLKHRIHTHIHMYV